MDGIDLGLLYECLLPQKHLLSDEGSWDPDTMFNQLKQSMQEESDARVSSLSTNTVSSDGGQPHHASHFHASHARLCPPPAHFVRSLPATYTATTHNASPPHHHHYSARAMRMAGWAGRRGQTAVGGPPRQRAAGLPACGGPGGARTAPAAFRPPAAMALPRNRARRRSAGGRPAQVQRGTRRVE